MFQGTKVKSIQIIVRAIILKSNQILLCRTKGANFYFLPGGHVEFGETLEKTLRRELNEELGVKIKSYKLFSIIENRYGREKDKSHEINFVYKVILKNTNINVTETHVEFYWKNIKTLNRERILPIKLKSQLLGLITKKS